MRLPNTAQTSWPWRIHEFTRDFRLEDVGAADAGRPRRFPVVGAGLPRPTRRKASLARPGPSGRFGGSSASCSVGTTRTPASASGCRRCATGCRPICAPPSGPDFDALPFTSLHLLDDEWAAEIANQTMHGVMHVGWVPDQTGGYRGQMAVYVKPNGLFGAAYMAAIRPFRHLIVYPPMMRQVEREWRVRAGEVDICLKKSHTS